jgi:PAS domain S-box-containing protein
MNSRISLRLIVGIGVLFVLFIYLPVLNTIQYRAQLRNINEFERVEVQQDTQRLLNVISFELDHLKLHNAEYSEWDDTYQFASDRNDSYRQNNLLTEAQGNEWLSAIHILDRNGDIIWGCYIDHESDEIKEFDPVFAEFVKSQPSIHKPMPPRDSIEGLLMSPRGPMLYSVQPIVTSNGSGPPNGILAMGAVLDGAYLGQFSKLIGRSINIWPADADHVVGENKKALDALLSGSTKFYVHIATENTIHCYTLYRDLHGGPGILLCVSSPRTILPLGMQAARANSLLRVAAGLLLVAVMTFGLNRFVIRPLIALTNQVTAIDKSQPLRMPKLSSRRDEIGKLAAEFESMMDRLHTDAEQRRRTEDALRASESRVRAILESAPDAIISAGEDGTIESVNRAAELMFDYPAEALEKHDLALILPEHARQLQVERNAGAKNPSNTPTRLENSESTGVRKDGTNLPLLLTCRTTEIGTERIHLIVARDVSEMRRMHERMIRHEHLAMLGAMGASLAHEIKNPLAAISCAIQVLRDGLSEEDARREVIKEILEQIGRLDHSVRDLLMFGRPWTPEKSPCDLRELVDRVNDASQASDVFARIAFEVHGPDRCIVHADATLLQHVLNNIYVNAAHAMPDGGVIAVHIEPRADSIRLRITDTGCGIPIENMDRVFQPFFTTKTRGTGLGLAVSKTIMEVHGGQIRLTSAPGKGTEVILELGPCMDVEDSRPIPDATA